MKLSKALQYLERSGKKVFSIYDAAKVIGKPTAYTSLLLSKSKDVERIEKGRYFIKGTDMYEIASNILFPSYVSLYAAMQYYELIDQNIIRYSVIALKRHKPIILGNGSSIEFITVKSDMMFGYTNKNNVYIASPEKLFIDCLYLDKVPFSELKNTLEVANADGLIDSKLIIEYAIRTGSSTLVNKLGFLLESAGISFDEEKMLKLRYHSSVKIHGAGSKGKNKKWLIDYD